MSPVGTFGIVQAGCLNLLMNRLAGLPGMCTRLMYQPRICMGGIHRETAAHSAKRKKYQRHMARLQLRILPLNNS